MQELSFVLRRRRQGCIVYALPHRLERDASHLLLKRRDRAFAIGAILFLPSTDDPLQALNFSYISIVN